MENKKAPSFEELQEEIKSSKKTKSKLSVKVIGCGGGGINIVTKLSKKINKEMILLIDTSYSNINDENSSFELLKIQGSDGSGKYRISNYDEINKFISNDIFDMSGLADINIIFFSLSGGSGSVIAPLLLSEIKRRKKIGICVAIADSESYIDITNTFNTINSIEKIAIKNNIYIPFMLFDNSYKRSVVDATIIYKVEKLINILSEELDEIDNSDIINWLQPINMFKDIHPGIKTLFIDTDVNGTWDESSGEVLDENFNILDSMLIVSDNETDLVAIKKCRVIFKGFNPNYKETIFVGNVGIDIPNSFFKKLNDKMHEYKSIENQINKEKIDAEYKTFDNETDSGMVL